jgi:hypothetical protein
MYAKKGRFWPPFPEASFFSNLLFAFLIRFLTFFSASLYSSVGILSLHVLHSLFFLLIAVV